MMDTRRLDLDRLSIAAGCAADYAALGEHHYLADRPATMTRVLALRDRQPSVVGRYLKRRAETQVVGVLVESMPMLNCRQRDDALNNRYASMRDLRVRAAALRRELRCISRVVIDPRWRGLGLAVRLVRAALEDPQTPLTESLASMGRVHPFFERAGMTPYDRPPHDRDRRLIDALASAGLDALDLATLDRTLQRINDLPRTGRDWLATEVRRWHARLHRKSPPPDTPLRDLLREARTRLFSTPVYYLKDHRQAATH